MSVFDRYKMLRKFSDPNFKLTPEDLAEAERVFNPEEYGELQEFQVDSNGLRVDAHYQGKDLSYFIPDGKSWISGKSLDIQQAYMIVEQNDKTMKVREVRHSSEINAIKSGLIKQIRKILDKNKSQDQEGETQ